MEKSELEEFYKAMGKAIKDRDRALAMIENWSEKLNVANAEIEDLIGKRGADATSN